MSQEYWLQQGSKPLFPDILWSRPETRQGAGKLLVIGGQAQEFANVAECYAAAERAGAGTIRVIMPESTRKVTGHLPNIEYAASNQSGSFAAKALDELLSAGQWADGVLLAGNLGKNSETSLMLEKFFNKYAGLLFITSDAQTSLSTSYENLFSRNDTTLVLELNNLQKAVLKLQLPKPITSDMSSAKLAETLHEITEDFPVTIVARTDPQIWAASKGRVVSSPNKNVSMMNLASVSSVWTIQNPTKIFEAVTTSLYS